MVRDGGLQVVARLEGFQFDESVSDGDGLVPESAPHWQFRLVKYDKSLGPRQ